MLYRIENLPLVNTPSPCTTNVIHRFVRKDAGGDGDGCDDDNSEYFPEIADAIEDSLLSNFTLSQRDTVRVLDTPTSIGCLDSGDDALGASFTVTIPGTLSLSCWTHSYRDEWDVFVFNEWAVIHPGNSKFYINSKPNPIANVAEQQNTGNLEDLVTLSFPPWAFHASNFDNYRWRFKPNRVGSWGERVTFNNLPDPAKSAHVVTDLGGTVIEDSGHIVEVCGSPGEVSNDPAKGNHYHFQKFGDAEMEHPDTLDQDHERWQGKQLVWNTVSVTAPDQLRHRVSWAFASIFVVTELDIDNEQHTEAWANFYDIFVRNASGNFFSMLKEVSFNVLMGRMLTFHGSKSLSYNVERNNGEIMQLFTIGLYMLNQDGTLVIDKATGQPVPTYDNEDIINFSRGWTNFVMQEEQRDNAEPKFDQSWVENQIDPMVLPTSEGRDFFPKQTLLVDGNRGYVGDQMPRCDQMPEKPWLRQGAVWEFRTSSQSLMGKQDPLRWFDETEPDLTERDGPRLVLDSDVSSLYAKLCNLNAQTDDTKTSDLLLFTFRSTVILDEDILCDGTCTAGQDGTAESCECSIDEPRTVRIDHSPTIAPVWYEYKRPPCIQMAYPEPGSMNSVKEIGATSSYENKTISYGNSAMCADSRYAVAGTTCCDGNGDATNICVFKGERTTYQTAVDRCAAIGYSTCSWDNVTVNKNCGTNIDYGQDEYSIHTSPGMRFSWSSEPCSMSAQIDQDGKVAIIHNVGLNTVKGRVGVDTGTYFGALWDGVGSYPQANSGCGGIGCQAQGTTCICPVTVQTTHVYDGNYLPSASDVISQLHIGAVSPSMFDPGHYHLCTAPICVQQSYNIFTRILAEVDNNLVDSVDQETIFEVTNPKTGEPLFLSNTKSTVDLGGGFSFRNPPSYNSPVDPTQRDALYETDDILNQYFFHPNTAPFIATKLIQHLITSNPSPRYVKVVADAFASGFYSSDGINFGEIGDYGNLEATIAAVMLDSDARSSTLDDDANHGRAREPLLKIIHMYRSMELSTSSGANREIDMLWLLERGLGQEAFRAPSVFSFFLSEYQPVGPVLNRGLVSPESQLFDAPKLIGFINGLFSLPALGLTDCEWGLGDSRSRLWLPDYPDGGKFDCFSNPDAFESQGVPLRLRWTPPSWGSQVNANGASAAEIISDIDLLLTGGKLHSASRDVLEQIYQTAHTGSDPDNSALRAVIQYYAAVPEFHITSNLIDSKSTTTTVRDAPEIEIPQDPVPVQGYKAIVYLYLNGASDSFSMLAPIEGCGPLHSQYLDVRGDIAIQSELLLPINATTSNQPCSSFGLHPALQNIQNLYTQGDASWVSNVGPLIQPITKAEFFAGTKPVPNALFAHNTQTQVTQTVFAQDSSAGGVLGRIGDAINDQEGEEVFSAYSISGTPKVLEGAPGVSRPADVLTGLGVSKFGNLIDTSHIETLSQNVVSNIHGETFSASLTNTVYRMRHLDDAVGNFALANETCFNNLNADIASQLKIVARVMGSRDILQAKRDAFYTYIGGFDTHSDNGPLLTYLLTQVDGALGCFKSEMDSQGIWNNVTIVSASEFGRTLTSNGLGTDHAWGGNYFILGGNVKGGLIHGQYPADLTDQGSLNIGRGRLIPT
ncbi:hypothetical protein ACHAXR_009213, partial [Thalassiosira sp. AJA248-18]